MQYSRKDVPIQKLGMNWVSCTTRGQIVSCGNAFHQVPLSIPS